MNISIQSKGGTPIYEQIATQIKEAILAGKLNKDDALPSIRALSADIKVSVITTKKAYEELEKEKMIYSVPGKGFFVDNARGSKFILQYENLFYGKCQLFTG